MERKDIKSLYNKELEEFLVSLGEKPFRARQIYAWLHVKHAVSFEEMTDLSKQLKEKLTNACRITVLKQERMQRSKIDGYRHGNSVCVSSQAGCRMGCRFCASALGGLVRNLTAGEMLEQVYRIQEDTGERVSHVVVMGTGEPLDNYDNFLRFVRLLSDEKGMNISQRNITASTCGIVPGIRRLAEEGLQITLALSLHAPAQEKRLSLMPVAGKYGLQEVIEACRDYFASTGRRITFEYSLMGGINDSREDARQLARLIQGMNCHVNLIPVNPVDERDYAQPSPQQVSNFKNNLEK